MLDGDDDGFAGGGGLGEEVGDEGEEVGEEGSLGDCRLGDERGGEDDVSGRKGMEDDATRWFGCELTDSVVSDELAVLLC